MVQVSPPARSARGMSPPDLTRSPLRFGRYPEQTSGRLAAIFRKASVVAGQALYNDKTGKEIFL